MGYTIIATKEDLLTRYDVTAERYVINERGKKLREIAAGVEARMREEFPEEWEALDYFKISDPDGEATWPREWRWLKIFCVTGLSEGHYVHVETEYDRAVTTQFIGKTFLGRKMGARIVAALMEVFDV